MELLALIVDHPDTLPVDKQQAQSALERLTPSCQAQNSPRPMRRGGCSRLKPSSPDCYETPDELPSIDQEQDNAN